MKKNKLIILALACHILSVTNICFAKNYSQKDGLFSIDIPDEYTWAEAENITITGPGEQIIIINLRPISTAGYTLEEKKYMLQRGIQNTIEAAKTENGSDFTEIEKSISGEYARQVDFLISRENQTIYSSFIAFLHKDHLFTILIESLSESDKLKLKQIAENLELDPKETERINPIFMRRGDGAYKDGVSKDGAAIKEFDVILASDPNNLDALHKRADLFYRSGDLDSAIQDYSKIISIDPGFGFAFSSRGNAYRLKGQIDNAIIDFNQALINNPSNIKVLGNRGTAYLARNELDKALNDFNKLIELDPSNVDAYNNRCGVYANLNQLDKAIQDCSKAIELQPDFGPIYYNRGNLFCWTGEYAKGLADLRKAEELGYQVDPSFIEEIEKKLEEPSH